LAAASAAVVKPGLAQTSSGPIVGKDTPQGPGVVLREYGQEQSLVPGIKTVTLRDVIVQPGASTKENAEMMNAMLCHISEGELEVVQDGKPRTARTHYVWTCNKGTKEHVTNKGTVPAVMRIIDLMA